MAVTTTDAVYRGIRKVLHDGALRLDDAYIFITPIPLFTEHDHQYMQIIPGASAAVNPHGGDGLVEEDFRVVMWGRLWLDEPGKSDMRLMDSARGLMARLNEARADLIQSTASLTTVHYVIWRQRSNFVEQGEPGWAYVEDQYSVRYEIAWSTS